MKAPSLNELPYNLESRQLRIFENIRFLIQCLENSYSHLELELITLTDKKIELPRLCFIVNSAWSIIDIYQRLHTCIFKLKFIEGRSLGNILGREFKKTFNSQMSSVTGFRFISEKAVRAIYTDWFSITYC